MSLAVFDKLARSLGRKPAPEGLSWHPPTLLDQGAIGGARLALGREDRGLAVWENAGKLWTLEQGAGTARALVRLPLAEGREPRLALDPQGRGAALWTVLENGETVLMGKSLGWGETIAQSLFRTPGRIHNLQALVDRRGGAMAVWCHETDGRFEILAQAFDTRAGRWDPRPALLGDPAARSSGPGLAMNSRGHAMVVVPVEADAFTGLVCFQYWPTDRIWSDRPVPVCPGRVLHHRVAMDAAGNAQALLITGIPEERAQLFACRYDAHLSEWAEPVQLAAGRELRSLRIAMSPDGTAIAAWNQAESSGNARLFCRWFRNGAWDAALTALDSGHGAVADLALDLADGGRGALLTCHRSPEGYRVFLRDLEAAPGAPVALGEAHPHPAVRPRLVRSPDGAAAIWVQMVGEKGMLYLSHGR